jgi:hypothetical protein
MRRTAFAAAAIVASALLLAGCTPTGQANPTPSATPTSDSSAIASPPPTACDAGALSYLDGVATQSGTSPTRLTDPITAGYPKEVGAPDCGVEWTTSDGKPGYGGLYVSATEATYNGILQKLKSAGITTKPETPTTGMSQANELGLVSGSDLVQGGHLLFINAGASSLITTPTVLFVWVHILS